MGKRQLSNEDIFAKINSFSSENQSDSSISNEDIFAKINSFNDTTESNATPKVVKKKKVRHRLGRQVLRIQDLNLDTTHFLHLDYLQLNLYQANLISKEKHLKNNLLLKKFSKWKKTVMQKLSHIHLL